MNGVAPPAGRAPPAAAARRRGQGDAAAAVALERRPRAVRGQLQDGGVPASARSSRRAGLQHLAREPAALPDGEVRVLEGSSGSGDGRPARGPVERRQLAHQHAHRPAVRDDVVHARAAARARPPRAGGGRRAGAARGRDRTAAPPPRGEPPPPRLPRPPEGARGRPRQDALRRGAATTAPARPSAAAKVVRSDSCRRTISSRAARERPPASRPAAPAKGAACCRPRLPARAGRGTRAAPGRRRAGGGPVRGDRRDRRRRGPARSRRAARRRAARPATRRGLEQRAQRKLDPEASRTRDTTRVASSEWPPRSKKSSSSPTRVAPSTSAQSAGQQLLDRRARRREAVAAPARRPSAPAGPGGRACRWASAAGPQPTKATGTM